MKLVSKADSNRRPSSVPARSSSPRVPSKNRTAAQNRNQAESKNGSANKTAASAYKNSNGSIDGKQKTKKRISPVKAILIILLVFVVGAAGLFVALGFYVESLDTVFPNVWAENVNLSGLTLQEAKDLLISEGYESNAQGISATVILPDGSRFTVTGEEVGLSFNAEQAALAAFKFGREGSFFDKEITYIRSLFNRTELSNLSTPVMDDSLVRTMAATVTESFNNTLFDGSFEQTDDYITITKGTGIHPAIESEVFELAMDTLMQAIAEHSNLTNTYTPRENAQDSLESQINELELLFGHIHVDAVSSQLFFNEETESFAATESSSGRTFDFETAVDDLRRAENGFPVVIPIVTLEPEHTREDMEALLFRDVLAESTTREITGNSNRLSNIQLSARKIDGTILNPGDVFSFNNIVGERTKGAGFLEANTIRAGVFEPGIGGGICQVSSTIHDAVVHTHLEVVERSPHGLRISYMPRGEDGERRFANDAMVNWGTNDYKFKNNTDFPIKVEAKVNGRDLTIKLIGTKFDDNYIVIETVVLSESNFTTVERPAPDLLVGERRQLEGAAGQKGYRAETFQRLYSADGELISRTSLGISRYNAQNKIILVGTKEPPQDGNTGGGETGTGGGETGTGGGETGTGGGETGTGGGETGTGGGEGGTGGGESGTGGGEAGGEAGGGD